MGSGLKKFGMQAKKDSDAGIEETVDK